MSKQPTLISSRNKVQNQGFMNLKSNQNTKLIIVYISLHAVDTLVSQKMLKGTIDF